MLGYFDQLTAPNAPLNFLKLPLYAEAVQSALNKLGFDIQINSVTTEIFLTRYRKTNNKGCSNSEYDAKLEQLSSKFDAASILFGYPQTNIINNKKIAAVKIRPTTIGLPT